MITHDYLLYQGSQEHDRAFLLAQPDSYAKRTQHHHFLMRSQNEANWARRFEKHFAPAPPSETPTVLPCYFFEPAGLKKFPSYPPGKHYRIDFVLVYSVEPRVIHKKKNIVRSCARHWEWVSIKPLQDTRPGELADDLGYLRELVMFDSKHSTARQCCGEAFGYHRIHVVTYDVLQETTVVETKTYTAPRLLA